MNNTQQASDVETIKLKNYCNSSSLQEVTKYQLSQPYTGIVIASATLGASLAATFILTP